MLAWFDPVMQKHVDRITSDKNHDHYLGSSIKNEILMINLLGTAVGTEIIGKVRKAK